MINFLKNYIKNYHGYKTTKKQIVFLVDDYGSVLISPSNDALQKLTTFAPTIAENRFNKYDDIASKDDLLALFDVLTSVKDKNGRSAVFTPMTVVGNPDFEEIKKDNFQKYHYETFFQTIARREDGNEIKLLWEQGIGEGIFVPEFHGREHLNVRFWLRYLQNNDENIKAAFSLNSIGIKPSMKGGRRYMAAFDVENEDHLIELNEVAKDGLRIFEQLFGYKSTFFTSPTLIHSDALHETLKENGVNYIDVARTRIEPMLNGKSRKRYHYMGQKNQLGQYYITRNVMFEPNKDDRDWVKSALKDIEVAFTYKKPAIISSHRVNFVGGKDKANREKGLKSLKSLLDAIVKKWPDVEFVTIREIFK